MNRKLPVWQVFSKALSLVWEKRGFAAAIGWPLILLTALWGLGIDAGYLPSPLETPVEDPEGAVAGRNVGPMVAYIVAQSFLLAIVAVFWHRNILLQEVHVPVLPFRADQALWRYIGYALAVFLAIGVIAFAGILAAIVVVLISGSLTGLEQTGAGGALGALIVVPVMVVIFVIGLRYSLVLPAAAIGHQGFGLGASWRATRGNSMRIVGLHVLAALFALVTALVEYAAIGAMGAAFGAPPYWFRLGANAAVNFAVVLLGIGLLSLTYAYLTHDMPQDDAQMEA